MNYKIKGALKKSKMMFIIGIAIWMVLSILLSVPISVNIVEATTNGVFDVNEFLNNIFLNMSDFSGNLSKIFRIDYVQTFWRVEGYVTIAVLFFFIIGFIKSMPKNEYTDIENGSSDWAKGEQYSVLNKKKGILLAENHYLPVDKRGNTNVLVVGRFRFTENLLLMLFQTRINF